MRRLVGVMAIAVLFSAGLGACGGSGGDDEGDDAAATTRPTSGPTPATDGLDIATFDNYFDPKIITGEKGTLFQFDVINEGSALHNFSAPNVDMDIAPGKRVTVEVVFPEQGDAEFFCKYHKVESGMTGTLRAGA